MPFRLLPPRHGYEAINYKALAAIFDQMARVRGKTMARAVRMIMCSRREPIHFRRRRRALHRNLNSAGFHTDCAIR
jgi:hypothetical protein